MKLLYIFGIASLLSTAAAAQNNTSPRTRIFLDRMERAIGRVEGYLYRTDAAGNVVLPAMLLMEEGATGGDLEALGVHIGTRAGLVWTAGIPPQKLAAVAALKTVKYLELDEPLIPTMDSARRTTRVDSAHAGYGLPKGFSGNGVVMGVLDVGFDYTHPTLWDTTGTRYRVRRVWEQKTTGGTAPALFNYGRELTDSALIQAAGTDNSNNSHGAHVAGIATGSGRGAGDTTGRRYRGIAYASDVVLVGITPEQSAWTSTGMTDIINGMKYVYDYAGSVGKPAVVNLSWGCPVGPHDGRSLFSQACNNLTGAGKLFVLSAGNNGDVNLHVQKQLTTTDTAIHTFVTFPSTPIGRRSWLDVWGDSAQNLSVRLSLYNGTTRTDSSAWIPLGGAVQNVLLRGSAGDTLLASVAAAVAGFNNKPRILLEMESRTNNILCVSVRGTAGTVHGWLGYVYQSSGYYGSLGTNNQSWATGGNSQYIVSDMVTTRSALAGGAYASKNIYYNLAGTKQDYAQYVGRGRIVPFSSKGPSTDNRIKPDIAGPGLWLSSSVNSYDTSFGANGADRDQVVTEWAQPGGRTYQYAALTGTSMSSPAVAGIAALLLEAAPGLTPDSLRSLLSATAIRETFMGTLPNNTWGAGKANAYTALQRLMSTAGISEVLSNPAALDLLLYPNPSAGTVTLELRSDKAGKAEVTATDISGKTVKREARNLLPGANTLTMDFAGLPKGIYIISLNTPGGWATTKVTLR